MNRRRRATIYPMKRAEVQIFGDNACHSERMSRSPSLREGEGSGSTDAEILRCAQNDSQDISQVMSPLASRRAAHGKSYLQTSGGSRDQLTLIHSSVILLV